MPLLLSISMLSAAVIEIKSPADMETDIISTTIIIKIIITIKIIIGILEVEEGSFIEIKKVLGIEIIGMVLEREVI